MKRNIQAAMIATAIIALTSAPTYAHEGVRESLNGTVDKTERGVESVTNNLEDARATVGETGKSVRERAKTQQEQIDIRKNALKEKLQQKTSERKEKLEGARLAQCQNRQDTINSLMDKSASNGRERLQRIQRFEEGIKAFYEDHSLTTPTYAEAVSLTDEAEALAIATLDTAAAQEFDCMMVDGVKPSAAIESVRQSKQEALSGYRDSVKSLLGVVREAFTQKVAEVDDAA